MTGRIGVPTTSMISTRSYRDKTGALLVKKNGPNKRAKRLPAPITLPVIKALKR